MSEVKEELHSGEVVQDQPDGWWSAYCNCKQWCAFMKTCAEARRELKQHRDDRNQEIAENAYLRGEANL